MPDYGLTPQGFVKKSLAVVKSEIEASLRSVFGNGINLLPTELLGQLVGILSEREALLWELPEAVWNQFFPYSAQGINLDNVVSITGIKRLEATKGVGEITCFGTLGTTIPVGTIFSVAGSPTSRFLTSDVGVIAAGTNEVQLIQFSAVPDAGQWSLVFDGDETGTLAFNDNAAAIQSALNALPSLSGVTVAGDYTAGFSITFAGADGSQDQPLLATGQNTLTNTSISINLNYSTTTAGVLPNVTIPVIAELAGAIPAPSGSLTVIETPLAGLDSASNALDIETGNNIETDAELRLRRERTLSTAGAATLDAIRSRILEIDEVSAARVFENDTDVVDAYGRPPHSVEAVVVGGADQEIWDTIWNIKAAGIQTDGTEVGSSLDSMGFSHTVKFSRPTEIEIYITIDNLEIDVAAFPVDGEDAIKAALVEYSEAEFSIGDDVLQFKLISALEDIAGVIDFDLYVDVTPAPAVQDNIAIQDDEISVYDTSRIVVNFAP